MIYILYTSINENSHQRLINNYLSKFIGDWSPDLSKSIKEMNLDPDKCQKVEAANLYSYLLAVTSNIYCHEFHLNHLDKLKENLI